jgi:hypothetical protein
MRSVVCLHPDLRCFRSAQAGVHSPAARNPGGTTARQESHPPPKVLTGAGRYQRTKTADAADLPHSPPTNPDSISIRSPA